MSFKEITKRWKNVAEISWVSQDLVEIDNEHYILVAHYIENEEVINRFNSGDYKEKYTLEELKEKRSMHPNIRKMLSYIVPRKSKCICGATAANTTHSDWCPKYSEV